MKGPFPSRKANSLLGADTQQQEATWQRLQSFRIIPHLGDTQ
jgi:hypothetical protein